MHWETKNFVWISFFKDFIYLFLERGEGREKEKRHINVWLPLAHPLLGTWPTTQAWALDWVLNQQPFGSQVGTQSTEPHQPGLNLDDILIKNIFSALCTEITIDKLTLKYHIAYAQLVWVSEVLHFKNNNAQCLISTSHFTKHYIFYHKQLSELS